MVRPTRGTAHPREDGLHARRGTVPPRRFPHSPAVGSLHAGEEARHRIRRHQSGYDRPHRAQREGRHRHPPQPEPPAGADAGNDRRTRICPRTDQTHLDARLLRHRRHQRFHRHPRPCGDPDEGIRAARAPVPRADHDPRGRGRRVLRGVLPAAALQRRGHQQRRHRRLPAVWPPPPRRLRSLRRRRQTLLALVLGIPGTPPHLPRHRPIEAQRRLGEGICGATRLDFEDAVSPRSNCWPRPTRSSPDRGVELDDADTADSSSTSCPGSRRSSTSRSSRAGRSSRTGSSAGSRT